jgi:hypothetical protein
MILFDDAVWRIRIRYATTSGYSIVAMGGGTARQERLQVEFKKRADIESIGIRMLRFPKSLLWPFVSIGN